MKYRQSLELNEDSSDIHRKLAPHAQERKILDSRGAVTKKAADLSRKTKDAIRAHVAEGSSPEEKSQRRIALAEQYDVPIGGIRAITAYTKIWADHATKVLEEPPVIETIPEPQVIETPEPEPIASAQDLPVVRSARTGAEIDYQDSPEKKEWRRKKFEFLMERTTPQERAKMKVIALTGRQWIDATELYLPAGILPQNIVGVENSPEAWVQEEFERTGKSLDCETHPRTDLLGFLRNSSVAWNVVDFDFLGPICPKYIEILQHVRLSPRAFVFTNFMGKREGIDVQSEFSFQNFTKEKDRTGWQDDSFLDLHHRTTVEGSRDWENGRAPLKEMREDHQGTLVRAFLGTKRYEDSLHLPQLKRLLALIEGLDVENIACDIVVLLKLLDGLLKNIGFNEEERNDLSKRLYWLSLWPIVSKPFLIDHKGYKYISNHGKTPFISDFLEVRSGNPFYKKTKDTTEFLLTCLEKFYTVAQKKQVGTVECKYQINRKGKNHTGKLLPSDMLIFKTEGEKDVQISFGKLFLATDSIAAKFRIEEVREKKEGPRKLIVA